MVCGSMTCCSTAPKTSEPALRPPPRPPGSVDRSGGHPHGTFASDSVLIAARADGFARRRPGGVDRGADAQARRQRLPAWAGKGQWWKWKRDPLTVDAVLMYAQRGHGKRSSFYSDYTFGVWRDEELVPVGKAYFGFTDQELAFLDRWIRNHTTARFGPVREVEKSLVLEVAFDAVQLSNRHKSGVAMRFPRLARIRTDKPAAEADRLETLMALIEDRSALGVS